MGHPADGSITQVGISSGPNLRAAFVLSVRSEFWREVGSTNHRPSLQVAAPNRCSRKQSQHFLSRFGVDRVF